MNSSSAGQQVRHAPALSSVTRCVMLSVALAGAFALAGCSSPGGSPATGAATSASAGNAATASPSGSAPVERTTNAAPGDTGVRADGSHAFGSTVSIAYDDLSGGGPVTVPLTVTMTKGALADLAKAEWGSLDKPPASGWTPMFVTVAVKNTSTRVLQGGGLGGMTALIDSSGAPLQQYSMSAGVPNCVADPPTSIALGADAKVCVIYAVPDGKQVDRLNVLSGREVMVWR